MSDVAARVDVDAKAGCGERSLLRRLWRLLPAAARVRLRQEAARLCAAALIAALWTVEPFVRLRFAQMIHTRIGHLATNTDIFVRRLRMNGRPPRTRYIFVAANTPDVANHELIALWKRHIPVIDRGPLNHFLRFIWPAFSRSRFVVDLPHRSTEYREFILVDPVVRLSASDEARGRNRLKEMGIGDNDWFVCFHNREAGYYSYTNPDGDYSYHDYRDSDVRNYLMAARLIAEKGGYALRMGAVVKDKLSDLGEARIIDYASRYRDEFMDIYLPAKCRFFVGTASGLAQVPLMFDRPIAYANCVPLCFLQHGKSSYFIPKLFRKAGDAAFLSFGEMQKIGAFDTMNRIGVDTAWYRAQGVEVVENPAEDIRDLCLDMFDLVEGRLAVAEARPIQKIYKDRFFGHDPDRVYAPDLGPRFALKYRALIEG